MDQRRNTLWVIWLRLYVIYVKGSQIIIELEVSVVVDRGADAGAIFVHANNVVTQAKVEF